MSANPQDNQPEEDEILMDEDMDKTLYLKAVAYTPDATSNSQIRDQIADERQIPKNKAYSVIKEFLEVNKGYAIIPCCFYTVSSNSRKVFTLESLKT